jgi:hypothetical protein
MKYFADKKRRLAPNIKEGKFVWLDNLNLISPKRGKLDPLYISPFKVLRSSGHTYELDLPAKLARIYRKFHASLLRRYEKETEGHGVIHPLPWALFAENPNTLEGQNASRFSRNYLYL